MKFRYILSTMAVLGLIVTGAGFADANQNMNHNGNNNHKGAMAQLSTEQQTQYSDMRESNYDKMRPIYRELRAKKLELRALSNNPNTSSQKISQLAGEISNLHNKIEDNKIAFSKDVESKLGIEYSTHGNYNHKRGNGMMRNGHRGNGHNSQGMMHGGHNNR